jgi:hypothetical protein
MKISFSVKSVLISVTERDTDPSRHDTGYPHL